MIRRLVPTLVACLAASACVWPVPLPGEPVPTIESAVTWDAAAGTVTMEITVTDLAATTVRAYPGGLDVAGVDDTAAPFTFVFDTATFPADHRGMLVLASDGATIVGEIEAMPDVRCNGHRELCDRPYADVRNITTHNAMSSADDGWLGPNQTLDVPDQLEAGVRALMLDTYRAGDLNDFGSVEVPGVDPDTPYLCHAICALGNQPLVEGLTEIREFLDADPGAVVTLIIESYLDHDLTAAAFDASGLTPHTYVHPGGEWPTLGEMIDDGTRLVVMQDEAVDTTYPWLMNVWQHSFETPFSAATPGDFTCNHLRGSPSNELFILNHFLTEVFGSPALAAQVNTNPFLLDRARECEAFHDTAATFVTVDFFEIGDVAAAVAALNGL
ncbi:MAG: hypothetical protein RIB98_00325 [Acidimicrobiales bacterium]